MELYEQFIKLQSELPPYVLQYFAAKNDKYQLRTRIVYAQDLKLFFRWLTECAADKITSTDIKKVSIEELNRLDGDDIDMFMLYLEHYTVWDERQQKMVVKSNSAKGKARKLATLRSFFKYLLKRNKIDKNPTELTETPAIHKNKAIFTLSKEQQDTMLEKAKDAMGAPLSGIKSEKRTRALREKTKYRDFAILATLLGTGVRVSELCEMNIFDVDFREQSINIIRKGGSADIVYYNSEVFDALVDYIDYERDALLGIDLSDDEATTSDGPLFVSRGGKRITPRRVQQLVKEYAYFAVPAGQKVTPHTLRKTFGTELYRKYRDLSLAQNALGHENSSTTSEYYVKFDKERLKVIRDE